MTLETRFQKPPSLTFERLTREGYDLRIAHARVENAKATVIIAPGLKEFIEKYYETIHWLNDQSFDVSILDWRGQGLSPRYFANPHKRGSEGFDHDVGDLLALIQETDSSRPRYLLAHSMGGNIALNALTRLNGEIDKAAFSAPMFGIAMPLIGQKGALKISQSARRLGLGKTYVPGHGNWSLATEAAGRPFLTSDQARGKIQQYWFEQDPHLQLGGVTWDWLTAALHAIACLDPQSVRIPCLITTAGKDRIVCNRSIRKIAAQIPDHTLINLEESAHEILFEQDSIRDLFLEALQDFFNA